MAKHEYRIEFNDFISKEDDVITNISGRVFSDPEEAAELGWQIMDNLKSVYNAEIENQGDQFMVYRREGTYDQQTEGEVIYTLRVLDESGEPYEEL